MTRFGVPGQNTDTLSYVDDRLSTVPVIQAPRRPGTSDKKFPLWCEWRVDKNAVAPAAEGEFWKLVKYENNGDATWVRFFPSGTAAGVTDIRDQVNTAVTVDGLGFIDIDAAVVATGANPSSIPLETVADVGTNTLDIQLQVSKDSTGAPADKNDAGICSFDDSSFVVNTDGYVTLIGGGSPATISFDIDTNTAPGTDPVLADGTGKVTVQGAGVANGTNAKPISTHSRAANVFLIEVQVATEITGAPADLNDAGLASFDDTQFAVDALGYVTLVGGAGLPSIQTLTSDDPTIVGPDGSGNIDLTGEAVVNATNAKPVFVDAGANALNVEVQVATEITGAPGDKNDAGLSSYNDTQFTVDADGYVALVGGGDLPGIQTLTSDDPTIVGPDGSGNIDLTGETVANATNAKPLFVDAGANALNVEVQVATAIGAAPGDKNDAGLASFDSADFTVDADGFVELVGAGAGPFVESITIDNNTGPGTNPVVPTAGGALTIAGAAVAEHSVPVEVHSRAANAYNIEVQVSNAITGAPADKNDAGIASFDDTAFSVTEHGYVTLTGGGGSGGWEFISTTTVSTGTTLDIGGISSTYFLYKLVITNLRVAGGGTVTDLSMLTSSDAGVSFDSTLQDYAYTYSGLSATTLGTGVNRAETSGSLTDKILIGTGNSGWGSGTNDTLTGQLYIYDPSDTSNFTTFTWDFFHYNRSSPPYRLVGGGRRAENNFVDALQFFMSNGENLESGTFTLWGLRNS